MSAGIITTVPDIARARADQERRRSNAAQPHVNRHRREKRGGGKGGRQGARRAACTGW